MKLEEYLSKELKENIDNKYVRLIIENLIEEYKNIKTGNNAIDNAHVFLSLESRVINYMRDIGNYMEIFTETTENSPTPDIGNFEKFAEDKTGDTLNRILKIIWNKSYLKK